MSGTPLTVTPILVRQDNYIWMLPTLPRAMAAVDPGEADPVIAFLVERGMQLSHILITHHHTDHIGGVEVLRQRYPGCIVVGSAADVHRLPTLDQAVIDGDTVGIGDLRVQVIATPGHTLGHVVYHVADAIFTGDTLFSCGCGRLFEGSAAQMWHSLQRLMALSETCRIFPGHEYTLLNLGFLLELEPENQAILAWLELAQGLIRQGKPTLPVSLAHEKKINPFLRCHLPAMAQKVGLPDQPAEVVFARLREMRNRM
ncbi:MAG: hydroxyacylglutathione hydrolase [Magnetococcales bacterium]|nr:hydroxyacylglutathione hydrolase [Magnetococcales bacterium]